MGWKYSIHARNNGYCRLNQSEKLTKHLGVALFWLMVFRVKYPIVDFMVRNGHKNCEKCVHENLICNKEYFD